MAGTKRTRAQLAELAGNAFRTGHAPTNADFQNLVASCLNLLDDDASRLSVDAVTEALWSSEYAAFAKLSEDELGRKLLQGLVNALLIEHNNYVADLADPNTTGKGDALVAGKRNITGALAFTEHAFHEHRRLNVKTDFGAAGDGVTNDTAAFNAALAVAPANGTITVPAGAYLLNSTVNATNLDRFVTLEGGGVGATLLLLNSGGIGIDATGSLGFRLKNIHATTVDARCVTPAVVGLLYARSTTNKYVEFGKLDGVKIDIHSNSTANGGKGTVAVYNNAAEIWNANDAWLIADNALVVTSANVFNINSALTTHETVINSNTIFSLTGATALVGYKVGPSLWLENAHGVDTGRSWFAQSGTGVYEYAIKIGGSTDLKLTGNIEGGASWSKSCVDVYDNCRLVQIALTFVLSATSDHLIYLRSGKSLGGTIQINDLLNGTTASNLVKVEDGTAGMSGVNIMLRNNQTLDATLANLRAVVLIDSQNEYIGIGNPLNSRPKSPISLFGAQSFSIVYVDANTTLGAAHYHATVDATGAARTITLPSAASCSGRAYIITKDDVSANAVTVAGSGGDTIVGSAVLAAQGDVLRIVSYGATKWLRW